jgi:hypothetical protein
MTVGGSLYQLRTLGRITKGKGGGYLPTPKATEWKGGYASKDGTPSLGRMAKYNLWPTPGATDGQRGIEKDIKRLEAGFKNRESGSQIQVTLDKVARVYSTPQARDYRTGQKKRLERNAQKNLNDQIGGQLNPTWVEWLMGYPSGWTVLEDWAMRWFQPKRKKRLKD